MARAVEKKGLDLLLAALARLPAGLSWRFEHLGGGPLADGLKRQAKELGIADRCEWRGSATQDEVLAALRRADLFCLPARVARDGDRDGLPNVIMEAMTQELPVVATRVAAIAEAVIDGDTGLLVPPEDAGVLAQAVAALAVDPDRRLRMGRAGRRRIVESFAAAPGVARLAARFGLAAAARGRLMRVAFYAPLKSPDHPVPSGDRRMARAFLALLQDLGHETVLASRFRSLDRTGDPERQRRLAALGARLAARYRGSPQLWFTYHLYHKAPDHLGPAVSRRLGIPYVVAEASVARRRAEGPWAAGYAASLEALAAADLVLAMTRVRSRGPRLRRPAGTPGDLPAIPRRRPLRAGPRRARPAPSPARGRPGPRSRSPLAARGRHDAARREARLLPAAGRRAGAARPPRLAPRRGRGRRRGGRGPRAARTLR